MPVYGCQYCLTRAHLERRLGVQLGPCSYHPAPVTEEKNDD